jgi:hypothetical protein
MVCDFISCFEFRTSVVDSWQQALGESKPKKNAQEGGKHNNGSMSANILAIRDLSKHDLIIQYHSFLIALVLEARRPTETQMDSKAKLLFAQGERDELDVGRLETGHEPPSCFVL